jgi:hypothetical protein
VSVGDEPYGMPQLGVDAAGDALVAWYVAGAGGGLRAASLRAGAGSWSAPQVLAPGVSGFDVAVNASGAAVVAWATPTGAIVADQGTVLGSWTAPVTVAAPAYRQKGVHVAVNDAGQAALAWRTRTGALATTGSIGGGWATTPSTLTTKASGSVDVAIDGAGNAAAVLVQLTGTSSSLVYVSRHPAGGTWSAPAPLSTTAGSAGAPLLVADASGTFVAAWANLAATSPPDGAFGPPEVVSSNAGANSLAIAPGRAVIMWAWGGAAVSSEPVA